MTKISLTIALSTVRHQCLSAFLPRKRPLELRSAGEFHNRFQQLIPLFPHKLTHSHVHTCAHTHPWADDERLDDAEQIERDAEEAYFDEDQG